MSFRLLGTNHTSFTVSDLERTLRCLRDCLGFDVLSRAPRDPQLVSRITGVEGADTMIAFLKAPGHTLELIQYPVGAAERYGVKPISPPVAIDQGPNKGRKVVYLRDWDGITIELIEVKGT